MPWGTTTTGKKAKEAAAKPGEALQGQFTKARQQAAEARHDQLVTLISSIADELREGLAPTLNGIRVNAARPFPIINASNQRIATSNGRLIGWSLANTGTGSVLVRFRTGRDVAGDIVAVVSVAAGATSSMRVGSAGGLSFGGDGMTIELVGTGYALEGSVHIGEVD